MPLGVECPSCQHRFAVPDKMSGRGVRCPRCEHPFPATMTGLHAPAAVTAVQPTAEAEATPEASAAVLPPVPVSANGGATDTAPPRVTAPKRPARPVRRLTRLVIDLPATVVSKMPGQPEGVAGLALIALLIGLVAWGLTALTSLEFVGLLVGGMGLLLGGVAVAALVSRNQKGLGLPVAATLVNLQATAFAALAAFAADSTGSTRQPGTGEPRNAISELREAMKKQDQNARLAAAIAVGQLAQDLSITVRELATLLRDNQHPVRAAAAEALGQIGPAARLAYPALEETFQHDQQETVRKNAVAAMKKIGPPTANDLVPALDQLKDKDAGVRAAAAQVIRLIGPDLRLVEPALRAALEEDKDVGVRVSAAQALYALDRQAEGVLKELVAGLKDTDAHVRARAAMALAGMRADARDAIAPLAAALKDP
ncbi:MAG: HEAT repeat domain-containing protein, partial [Gemmataceae bacterium]|nr:HEAT repeat domain-containing protein [Gemmataceae bacterium]